MLTKIKMITILSNKRNLSIVIIPSIIWMSICATYIFVSVGWENLWYLLPSEIIGIVLGVATPIVVLVVLFVVNELLSSDGLIAGGMRRQEGQIRETSDLLRSFTEETRDGMKALVDEMESGRAASRAMTSALEITNAGIEEIIRTLNVVVRGDPKATGSVNPPDANALAGLAQLVNAGLADMSVAVTGLLGQLMDAEERGRAETIEYIEGLVDAWTLGDKNVYFRALHHQLATDPERIEILQSLSKRSSDVSRNISKILREMQGFDVLAKQLDKNSIIRIVIEESDFWALREVVERHFRTDGTAKA